MLRNIDKKERFLYAMIAIVIITLMMMTFSDRIMVDVDEERKIIDKYTHNGSLLYVADQSTPPIRFKDVDGQFKGVVVDYMQQLSLEIGTDIVCKPYQWDEAQELLKEGKANCADMFMSKERKKYFAFSDPIYYLRGALAINAKDKDFSMSNLKGRSIATAKGDFSNDFLREIYPELKLVYVDNVKEGILMLEKGKVDGVVGDEPIVYNYIQELRFNDKLKILDNELYENPVVIAVPKAQEDLIPIINRGIKNINNSKKLEQIQRKWFGISAPLKESGNNSKYLYFVLLSIGVALILLSVVSIINRRLKEEVRVRTREIKEKNQELNNIINDVPAAILVVNKNKKIEKTNRVSAALLHKTKDSLGDRVLKEEGFSASGFSGVDEGKASSDTECKVLLGHLCGSCDNCIMERCSKFGDVVQEEVNYEGELYLLSAHRIGEEGKVLITVIDVTDAVVQRNLLLQSGKMVAVGQLAAGMAHELRNPLGIIRTQCYILQKQIVNAVACYDELESLGATSEKSFKYIRENIDRAGNIIDSVMNFWRVSDEEVKEHRLSPVLADIFAMRGENLKKKGIHVRVLCDERLTLPYGEEISKHIFVNLINNAIDAIDEDGEINIECSEDSKAIRLKVSDTGCGMDEKEKESIFNPFFTTKAPGKGTGLGLFIVYSEVQRINGMISVNSKKGEGTCFEITIPKKGWVQEIDD